MRMKLTPASARNAIEAGLRTYDKYSPFPEEINRKLISGLTDLHFAPTQSSADNLLKEGTPKDLVDITGNTVIDALFYVLENFKSKWEGFQNNNNRQILITAHRRENFGLPLQNICHALVQLIKKYDGPCNLNVSQRFLRLCLLPLLAI